MTSREHPSEAQPVESCTCEAPHVSMEDAGITDFRCPIHGSPTLVARWEAEHLTPRAEPYRVGSHHPCDTFTEWGVRWTDGDVTTTQGRASESDAEDFVEFLADCGLAGGSLVSRTVTRSEWRPVSESGAPDA